MYTSLGFIPDSVTTYPTGSRESFPWIRDARQFTRVGVIAAACTISFVNNAPQAKQFKEQYAIVLLLMI